MDIPHTYSSDSVDSEITQTLPDQALFNLGLLSRVFLLKWGDSLRVVGCLAPWRLSVDVPACAVVRGGS